MIVVLEPGTSAEELGAVLARLERLGLRGGVLRAGPRPLIHVSSGDTRRARRLLGHERVQGLEPTSGPRVRREGRRFHPYHTLRIAAGMLVLLGVLVVLAGLHPPRSGSEPAPLEPLPEAAWPWYLAPLRGLLALLPGRPAWLGPSSLVFLGTLVLALPLLDRTRGPDRRWPVLVAGLALLGALLLLGLLGGRS